MDHIAIMSPKRHLLEKILTGEKSIETRWYAHRIAPWGNIQAGDTIYFKNTGKPITVLASVSSVIEQEFSTPQEGIRLVTPFKNSVAFTEQAYTDLSWLRNKRYAIFIFLKDVQAVTPFIIDKTGFGNACAWISVPDITKLRKSTSSL